jgi:hypothetical protein
MQRSSVLLPQPEGSEERQELPIADLDGDVGEGHDPAAGRAIDAAGRQDLDAGAHQPIRSLVK